MMSNISFIQGFRCFSTRNNSLKQMAISRRSDHVINLVRRMSRHWVPAETELPESIGKRTIAADSKAVCGRPKPKGGPEQPVTTPIYHSSTYALESISHYNTILQHGGYIYSRYGNPTTEAAEVAINALEGGAGSLVFSSGMAAITTALQCFLKAGDHMVACNPVYSGTHCFISKILSRNDVQVTWVGNDLKQYRNAVKDNTKLLYGETPGNPKCSILDLQGFAELGQSLGVLTVVDSTLGSSYLQQPVKEGVDISLHSATKYLGGHSDVLAGAVTCRTLEQWKDLLSWRTALGCTLSPFDASLLTRGIKTLAVRMEKHSTNAQRIAEYLEQHPKVAKVYYPGLKSHPDHELAMKQMLSCGGMVSFEMDSYENAQKVVQNFKLIVFAVSLGGVESMIQHPASMTHGPVVMSDEERTEAGITEGLIRLSVGIENHEDLLADFEQALDQV